MIFDKQFFSRVKGDASSREFFRKKKNNRKGIIIYSKENKKKNLLIYDAINSLLLSNKLIAPRLINQKYSKNFIEVQDFGNETVLTYLKKNNNKLQMYKKIISLLIMLQKIKKKKLETFKSNYMKFHIIIKKYYSMK